MLARVVGASTIEVTVDLGESSYNSRIQKAVRASKAPGVYKPQELLDLSYGRIEHSELHTLFLSPTYQCSRSGLLPSKVRFLSIAVFREWSPPHPSVKLRSHSDEQGQSSFRDTLGHHFFDIPFAGADRPTGIGMKIFTAELTPAYLTYISSSPEVAREVIDRAHSDTASTQVILEEEGFS